MRFSIDPGGVRLQVNSKMGILQWKIGFQGKKTNHVAVNDITQNKTELFFFLIKGEGYSKNNNNDVCITWPEEIKNFLTYISSYFGKKKNNHGMILLLSYA